MEDKTTQTQDEGQQASEHMEMGSEGTRVAAIREAVNSLIEKQVQESYGNFVRTCVAEAVKRFGPFVFVSVVSVVQ
jgi:hypothetical protein